MKTIKKSSILKFIRATSMLVGFTLAIGSYDAEAKLPLNVFKGVTDCFPEGKKYLTPTIGMAALDGGIIENIRFYGNFTPAYRMSKGVSERDYANDTSTDQIWQMARILFPSTAGQLSADSTHRFNFGKYVKDPMTVALLMKYTDDIRSGTPVDEEKLKNDIMLSLGYKFQEKMTEPGKINLAYDLLAEDQSTIYKIMTETQLAIDDLNDYMNTQSLNEKSIDQRVIGQAKNDLMQHITHLVKDFNDDKIKALFMGRIQELYKVGSFNVKAPSAGSETKDSQSTKIAPPEFNPYEIESSNTQKTSQLDSDFFYRVKNDLIRTKAGAENMLVTTKIEDLVQDIDRKQPKQNFIIAFKEITLTPLLESIKNSILAEQSNQLNFIPDYTPEQIISAFFDYKFSTRGDIKKLLIDFQKLAPQDVNEAAINSFDPMDLLTVADLPAIADQKNYSLDDILALSTADIWGMPTPYRVGAAILSNGNTKKYDRKTNTFVGGEFADCVEISIRHLINCFLYDSTKRDFDFSGLNEYRKNLNNITQQQKNDFQSFGKFYNLQKVDFANDGSIEMRSQWNAVVGDLNSVNESSQAAIRYRQGNNELDAGFINLMRVFNKVLGVQFDPEPTSNSSISEKKQWLKESFEKIFEALNPHKNYSIDVGMNNVVANNKEISGVITITVRDENSNTLYSFDFRSDPDQHGQLQNYKISESLKTGNFDRKLINVKFNAIGAENAIWLLDKNADVRHSKAQTLPLFYQLYSEVLSDNNAKIQFLKKVSQKYEGIKKIISTDVQRVMLKNIMSGLSLYDIETFKTAAPFLLRLSEKEELKEFFVTVLKTAQMNVDFSNSALNMDEINLLCKMLKLNNTTLNSLNLAENAIDAEGAKEIAEALMANSTLTSLNFNKNNIGAEGTKEIAEALRVNKTLISLNLAENTIYAEGTKEIAEALMVNSTLTLLNLANNGLGYEGAKLIADVLKVNGTLTSLTLDHNLDEEGAKVIAEALKVNKTLTSLNLMGTDMGNTGAEVIAEMLKMNNTLTSLNLRYNRIGKEGAMEISNALKVNSTLTSLNLKNSEIDNRMQKDIIKTWQIIKRGTLQL